MANRSAVPLLQAPTIYNPCMVKFDPQKHHRRSIRLKGYDYASAGAYFVTIVTWHREMLFGEVVNGELKLNKRGKIAEECWRSIPKHSQHVELGAYVIMPNHVHGIIIINGMGENRIATNSSQSVGGEACLAPTATRNITRIVRHNRGVVQIFCHKTNWT